MGGLFGQLGYHFFATDVGKEFGIVLFGVGRDDNLLHGIAFGKGHVANVLEAGR